MSNKFPSIKLSVADKVEPMSFNDLFSNVRLEGPTHCTSDIVRSTLSKIPRKREILENYNVPQAFFFQPFNANTKPAETKKAIKQCTHCYAYIHPFVKLADQNKWICNFCKKVNECKKPIFSPSGIEKVNGSIEFPTTLPKKPKQPAFFYLLDTSAEALATGYLPVFCKALLATLDTLDSKSKIGFITYDSQVQLYKRGQHGWDILQKIIVSDLENVREIVDIVRGRSIDYALNLAKYKTAITSFLQQLPSMFQYPNQTSNASAMGAALILATGLASLPGGRITVVQRNKPNIGPGQLLDSPEPPQLSLWERFFTTTKSQENFYQELGVKCCEQNIAVDLFLLGGQLMGLEKLVEVAKHSGGMTYRFPDYLSTDCLQSRRFERSLNQYLNLDIGWNNSVRIHVQSGFRIVKLFGNQVCEGNNQLDYIDLPVVNPDTNFGFQVTCDEAIPDTVDRVCFQVVLTYMKNNRSPRTRVHTLALPVTNDRTDIFKSIDQECLTACFAKTIAEDASSDNSKLPVKKIRQDLKTTTLDIIKGYQTAIVNPPTASRTPQEYVQSWVFYMLALMNSSVLSDSKHLQPGRVDDQTFVLEQWRSLPIPKLMPFLLPRLFAVHQPNSKGGPVRLRLTPSAIDGNGAYLLDFGDIIYFLVGPKVSTHFMLNHLGIDNYNHLSEHVELPRLSTNESFILHRIIDELQNCKSSPAVLQTVKSNSSLVDALFYTLSIQGNCSSEDLFKPQFQ